MTIAIFAAMGLVTFVTRYSMIAALGHQLPPLVRRWLRHVPVAVLAALIAPAALSPTGRIEFGARAAAAVIGAVVAWRTRSVVWTIAAGLAAFSCLKVVGMR
jgi:branched-subunit amino acid transport protein